MTGSPASPSAVILAGPNGSGKSTAATRLLPRDMTFVNADLIAQEISGKRGTPADINAGRILLARVQALEDEGREFAFETTLATKMLGARLGLWREKGFHIHLVYFWLPSEEMAILRVQARVRDGGHDVPEATVRRRYRAGLANFFRYRELVDTWRLYDNSRATEPALIASGGTARKENSPKRSPLGGADGTMNLGEPKLWADLLERYE